jgi:hypothetical protein
MRAELLLNYNRSSTGIRDAKTPQKRITHKISKYSYRNNKK